MLGVDTNILVRAFLADDKAQAKKSQALLSHHAKENNLFISSYAILEFVWVLKVKKFKRQEIYEAVITLLDSPGIVFGQREVVTAAIEKFLKGTADFGDYIIIAEGEKYGSHSLKTFDQALLKEYSHCSMPEATTES